MTHRLIGAVLAITFTSGCVQPQGIDSKGVDAYFRQQLEKKAAPSMAVAIVKNGSVVYAQAFGDADLENDIAATPNTVYRIGSITKQFTATMIMQLVGEGKLTLDQQFRTILPDTPAAWDKVTVRQLLNHTSGIKAYTEVKGLFEDQAMKPTAPSGILKTVEKEPLDFEPGSQWHYNNTAYEILGMLIEKLDGDKYGESLHKRILAPLGMTNTYFTSERAIVKHRAQGYSSNGIGFQHAPYLNMDWPFAAGSIESTVLDLAKWDAALYTDKILPQSALKQMWTPTTLSTGKKQDYGFGWSLEKLNGVDIVEHGGGIHGFTTFIKRAPSKGLTIIILTNSDSSAPQQMASDAIGLVDPSLKVAVAKAVADKDKAMTDAAKATLQSMMEGKLDRTKITPEFNKLITDEMAKGAQAQLTAMGPINRFDLSSDETKTGMRTRTYLVTLGTTELKFIVAINSAGLIAGLTLHP